MDMRIFPTLVGKRSACINLDACARYHWKTDLGVEPPKVSPFQVDPLVCQDLVQAYHKSRNLYWSWGGYMENRSTVWAGSYLESTGNFLHLGVDCNVPVGTPVAAHDDCTVVMVDNDHPDKHGWGNRVIVCDARDNNYLIYAHLGPVDCKIGDPLKRGAIFAEVGSPEENGGWYPHLHLQEMRVSEGLARLKDLRSLDGYGHPGNEEDLRNRYRNPVVAFKL